MIKSIFFDFDGVIVDSFDTYYNMCSSLGKKYGTPITTKDSFRDLFNGNFYDMLLKRYPELDRNTAFFSEMRDLLMQNSSKPRLFKDIKSQIKRLSKKYILFIVSSNTTASVEKNLESNSLDITLFKEIFGADKGVSKIDKLNLAFNRYSINKEEVIFITDTLGDIKECKAIGIKCIAVTWGFQKRKTIAKGKPFKILSSQKEMGNIPDLVRKL